MSATTTQLLTILLVICATFADARLTIRHRRQVEREDGSTSESDKLPASEVVVIKDTVNPSLPGPLFLVPRLPGGGDAFDLDINEQDGTFSFGGQLPSHFHHHHNVGHQSFAGLFDAIQRRFDEMTRNMMSFNNFGPGFSPTTDISSLPDDYNKTDSEIVELNGQRWVKKTTTLKKGGPGASFFVRSTTFERVNENDNADVPAGPAEESETTDKKEKPAVIGGGEEENGTGSAGGPSAEGPKVEESAPAPSNTSSEDEAAKDNEPKNPDDAASSSSSSTTPDVVPSSSETPAAPVAESDSGSPAVVPADPTDAKDKDNESSNNNESNDTSDEREREGESLPSSSSSTTEQP